MCSRKEVKRVLDEAIKLGFTVGRASNGHYRFDKPGVQAVFFSSTPGDNRAILNGTAKLRRAAKLAAA
ncbi:hypothetical protein SAMN05216178_6907 [Pseudomonas saponiphila]|jgi:hypothetical protein|uniref:HicA toxin of toxin-antitoxin n=1 Tax=Pseudomonas saponiphila TaxID=556534 RepID=A0A1H5A1A7_9PSED|nr:hypothetical protein [Pseudomonas saponiphila]SED35360.1 hypothetical protein SAMN05216178_6907 [Pseudomonas saponiphila]